jgi:hypothetical protein
MFIITADYISWKLLTFKKILMEIVLYYIRKTWAVILFMFK